MCVCVLLRLLLSSRLQTLQQHHHPDVSKAAALISSPLLQQEDDISERLETTTFQVSLVGAFQDFPEAFQDRHHMLLLLFSTADGAGAEADGTEEGPAGV